MESLEFPLRWRESVLKWVPLIFGFAFFCALLPMLGLRARVELGPAPLRVSGTKSWLPPITLVSLWDVGS